MCTYGTVANSTSADWFQRTLVILVTSRPRVRLNSAGGGNYPRVGWAAGGGSGSGSRSGGCCFFATARWGTGWQRLSRLRPTVGIIFAGSLLCCLQKQLHCTYSLPTYLPTWILGKLRTSGTKIKRRIPLEKLLYQQATDICLKLATEIIVFVQREREKPRNCLTNVVQPREVQVMS